MSAHQETENTLQIINEMHINYLNDDCFMEIFKYLTTVEKIKASLVCTRWAGILVKKLDINVELIEEINLPDIVYYIKTCGNYLNYLKIDFDTTKDYKTSIIKVIENNCKNIMHLEFLGHEDGDGNVNDFTLNEDDIELIFKNNVSLRTLKLSHLRLDGKSLLKLQPHILEEFILCYCKFDSINYLIDFLSRLNNVRILEISLFAYDDENFRYNLDKETIDMQKKIESEAINGLNKSNCENMIKFSWFSNTGFDDTNELVDLLSKQKKLKELSLKEKLKVDEKFFEFLKDSLEVLEISLIESQVHFSFPQFKNLKVIKWSNLVISDEIVQILTMCKNLKDLKLWKVSDYLLTEDGESAFGQLENLESLGIRIWQKNIDNVLLAVTQCKDLKIIDITGCHFTDSGLKSLLKVPKLTNLNVSETNITDDQLEKLVKESSLLELQLFGCQNLSQKIHYTDISTIRWYMGMDINSEFDIYYSSSEYTMDSYHPSSTFDDDDSDEDNSDEDNSDEGNFDALEGINRLFEGFNVHDSDEFEGMDWFFEGYNLNITDDES